MRSRIVAYPLVGVFFLLAGVPLLFSGLLFSLTELTQQHTGAVITLYAISFALLIAFVFCVVFVHALLLSMVHIDGRSKVSLLEAFRGARKTYWRTLGLDAFLLLLGGALLGLILLNHLWVDILAFALLFVHLFFFLRAPLLLEKNGVFGALTTSVLQGAKKPVSRLLQLLGVIGWSLIPLALWLFLIRESFGAAPFATMASRIVLDWFSLLLGQQHVFWLYVASPATLWWRLALLFVHIAFLVSATLWLARRK